MDELSTMRYAHSDGHTDLCYDNTGKYLITCGTDGDIRIWKGFDDDDPESHHIGEKVSAVAFKEGMIYLSSDAYSVLAYTFPKAEFDGIIAQFSTSVYHIVCSKDGRLVASGGGDFVVKIYDTSNKNLIAFRGHDGPILSIALDPKGKFMASSSCDGTVFLWQIKDQSCIKKLPLFKKCNDMSISETLCRLDWNDDGQFLAIPVKKEIRLYQRDTWECGFTVTDPSIAQNLSIVTFSPCAKYIAASSVNGQMLVWDVKGNKCISRKDHEKNVQICSFVWNPSGKELAFCDKLGQLGIYENALCSQSDEVSDKQPGSGFLDLECMDDEDEGDDDDENENAFDIGAIKATLEPKIFGNEDDESISIKSGGEAIEEKCRVIQAPKAPVQTAFQPSSTPVNLERRFMLWNTVGIVRCYNTEEENSIDVEFHDTNVYHPLHMNNTRNHTMAALSTEALLMASPKYDDNLSKLECLHFGTWDSHKEWIIEIPEGEEIETIALGGGWAAAVTDKRFVRIFTISGVQTEVFTILGSVVCTTASNNQLAIAYHRSSGSENDQCLGLIVATVKLGGDAVVKEYSLPLSAKSFLNWLGYTDEGHICIVDTAGTVSLLNATYGNKWIPIADTKANLKGKSDSYFIIGLSEVKQEIRCILCKGSRYPALLPRPTVSVLPFSLPFCEMASEKGKFEEENQRYSLLHSCLKSLLDDGFDVETEYNYAETKQMEMLLKMFALATRTEREYRALDVAELMPNQKVIQGAIKYATQRHRIALAERLGEVMRKKIETEFEENNYERPMSAEYEKPAREPTSSRLSGLLSNSVEENVLHPKPLSRLSSNSIKRIQTDEGNFSPDKNAPTASKSGDDFYLVPKTVTQINPFKAHCKTRQENDKTADIDSMLKSSTKNLASKASVCLSPEKKQSKQSRLFARKKESAKKKTSDQICAEKKKFGFALFLDENKDKISVENIDLNERELTKVAIKLYKELPESEKKKYLESADEGIPSPGPDVSENDNTVCVAASEENKRELLSKGTKKHSIGDKSSKRKLNDEEGKKTNGEAENKKIKSSSKEKLSAATITKLTQFSFTKTSSKS